MPPKIKTSSVTRKTPRKATVPQPKRVTGKVTPYPAGAVNTSHFMHVQIDRMKGGNIRAVVQGVAAVKPFSNRKKLSKAIGLYDKIEKTPLRFLNRIADAGEAVGQSVRWQKKSD